jgi:CRISPR system Cascade subunit CasE
MITEQLLQVVKIPLRLPAVIGLARKRNIPLRDLDEGYLVHCLLTELWQSKAPAPFLLKGASVHDEWGGRGIVDVWGYTTTTSEQLQAHAQEFGDPELLGCLAGPLHGKEMPLFAAGRRLAFTVRACPIVRTKSPSDPTRKREVDAYIAARVAIGDDAPPREEVYLRWLRDRFANSSATLQQARVLGMKRERVTRRTQGAERTARTFERPDVTFEGELTVNDASAFGVMLGHGVGRHRAFGFGMLLLSAPGAP